MAKEPRVPTVTAGPPATAVSDQARNSEDYQPKEREARTTAAAPEPGEPYHAAGWGGKGTDGTGGPPPRSAVVSATPQGPVTDLSPQMLPQAEPTSVGLATVPPPGTGESYTPDSPPQPSGKAPDDRVGALEQQVASLGTLLATVSSQLQSINVGTVQSVIPGTANPLAPTHHAGSSIQGAVAKVEGPVIPKPDPQKQISDKYAPKLPDQSKIPELLPGEENLTQSEYIEKHYRARDLSIAQIAYMCNMEENDVTDILKEIGYQLPEDV